MTSVMKRSFARSGLTAWQFALLIGQLLLLTLVIRQFQIESRAFLRLAILAFLGFAVHAWLPLRYRLPFFLGLSFAGIGVVLGLVNGVWLVALGLILIGICHLPVKMPLRVALLLLVAAALAFLRADWLHAPWPSAIWPILGSMFMFRLIVYLYDLAHDRAPVSPTRTLAYFFLLPNVCFPLFPVVDFKTFRRSHYDSAPYPIYQIGVDWIARGVLHLILYRLVYYHFTLAPSEVASPATLAQYMLSTFLLYLRVSGQFHVIVGLLHLFGFNLPETHHRYYLASSFTDFWRRINIYWKDFMLKVVYYPLYFTLRRWGTTQALVLSTLFVFLATWLLHSYQWFWLRGSFPVLWQDLFFWGILGVLVVLNALWEAKRGRERSLRRSAWTAGGVASLTLRTGATFAFLCLLWSLWTAESVSTWLALWGGAAERPTPATGWLPTVLLATILVGSTTTSAAPMTRPAPRAVCPSTRAITLASPLALAALGVPDVYSRLGASTANFIHSLRSGGLSRLDNALLERGYYEDLLRVDRFNSQLWEVYMNKPLDWLDAFEASGLERFTDDFAQKELVPSFRSLTRHGTITTNRWGMRDRDYDHQPAPGTYRVALLGASTVMGWGVGDEQTFESLLEARLNHDHANGPFAKYEILNFGVPNYSPLQQLGIFDKVLSFGPHAVFYVATRNEVLQSARYLAAVTRKGIPVPNPLLRAVVERAHIDAATGETVALRRLEPFLLEILSATYDDIVKRCRERSVLPVWIFLPHRQDTAPVDAARIATAAGFTVLTLEGYEQGHDPATLRLAEWDDHPNALGHRLIAGALYRRLTEHVPELFVDQRKDRTASHR